MAVFSDLLAETGVIDPDQTALQLTLLYDGAMSSAQVEPHVAWAEAAKRTASTVIEAELPPHAADSRHTDDRSGRNVPPDGQERQAVSGER